ncbi:unnamed protein product [Triticum turgidum subsp. durum]|uniref:Flavin-containing monooxygenase n=1 Tax=Triticum turgidum subsp. durum TaxID=4567 RepID=A0A9R0WS34_TRITD|nr:unnamed protein product [Triticum turgidum subsp. durum]
MVPDYSYSFAMSSCLIALLPEGFYDRVDEGSIILKKSKKFSFCSNGIIMDDGNECINSDIVILATGFRGDQKLRDIFTANWCRNIVVGSSDTSVPLYRYRLDNFFLVGIFGGQYILCYRIHFFPLRNCTTT